MLAATKKADKKVFMPGEVILQQGIPVQQFYMIESGEVDILGSGYGNHEYNLATMGPGQFFGEISLLHGGDAVASVRAAGDAPVQVAVLARNDFIEFLDASPQMRKFIAEIAQSRIEENRNKIGETASLK
mgnify:CR=1 FL=1